MWDDVMSMSDSEVILDTEAIPGTEGTITYPRLTEGVDELWLEVIIDVQISGSVDSHGTTEGVAVDTQGAGGVGLEEAGHSVSHLIPSSEGY